MNKRVAKKVCEHYGKNVLSHTPLTINAAFKWQTRKSLKLRKKHKADIERIRNMKNSKKEAEVLIMLKKTHPFGKSY